MTSSIIWIFFPALSAIILWFIPSRKLTIFLGMGITTSLALLAWLLPIDLVLNISGFTFKISSTMSILGRQLVLDTSNQPLMIYLYLSLSLWYICVYLTNAYYRMISYGLMIMALMISALVVKPFLYASLLIQIAILVSIPLLRNSSVSTGRGISRFLVFETLALPFILFSGWLLTGISASPENISFTFQSSTLLGLGFVFLLNIFPFNNWIPLLAEEVHPLSSAIIFWIFPTVGLLFGCFFLDSYAWLRDSSQLSSILLYGGLVMVLFGGIWAAFQKNLNRMFAYAMIMEIGYSLIALNLRGNLGMQPFFAFLIPRTITIFLWTSAVSILTKDIPSENFSDIKSLASKYPFASIAIIISQLSFVGLPLLAGFPNLIILWGQVSLDSLTISLLMLTGTVGLAMGAIRTMAVLLVDYQQNSLQANESPFQKGFLLIGIFSLILLGLFPKIVNPLISNLPLMFSHLGR